MASIEWNKVTWYSKLLSVAVFVATFLIAFDLGAISEQAHIAAGITALQSPIVSTSSAFHRNAAAATSTTGSPNAAGAAGAHCGGFIRNPPQCASGFHCQLNRIVDTGGTCVVNATSSAP